MANKYGEAALMAARYDATGKRDPAARWADAMAALYPTSLTSRKKRAPRSAFLGLCEEGLVTGTPPGAYSALKEDKSYAVQAVALLAEGTQSWSTTSLWKSVTGDDPAKRHNSQMDVVMALWKNGLIVTRP